jgi:hypothetical protein
MTWLKWTTPAVGLFLAASTLHATLPVAAQTLAPVEDRGALHDPRLDDVFAVGLDDRQANLLDNLFQLNAGTARLEGLDDILSQAQNIGLDDRTLADMLEDADARQGERALEIGDDRLSGATQQPQPGDVRQEDRGAEPGDVRQEDRPVATPVATATISTSTRGSDDGARPSYYTAPATTSAPATATSSGSSNRGGSSSPAPNTSGRGGGGHDDPAGHH